MLSRLTTLGWVLVSVVVLTIVTAIVILSQPPSKPAKQPAATAGTAVPVSDEPTTSRVYDGYDAIDFVRLTYEQYLATAAAEAPLAKNPPYDLNTLLRRLESVRPRLSANIYQNLVSRYTEASTRGGVQRDELLCGRPDITSVTAALRLGGNQNVVVTVSKQAGSVPAGSLEATVNLQSKQIVEISC